jgi:misacylated tRNA(Ala) deacylase
MGEWLFQTEAYVREFQAQITAVEGGTVALDRTAFYPGGGGQPADRGWLQADGGTHVANTREVGRMRVVDYKSKGRLNKRIEIVLE